MTKGLLKQDPWWCNEVLPDERHLQQADSVPVPAENPQEPQGEPPPSQTFEAEPYAEPPPFQGELQGERPPKGDPPGDPPPEEDKDKFEAIYCKTCDMWLNGITQWKDHKIGRKHRKNLRRNNRDGVHEAQNAITTRKLQIPRGIAVLLMHETYIADVKQNQLRHDAHEK